MHTSSDSTRRAGLEPAQIYCSMHIEGSRFTLRKPRRLRIAEIGLISALCTPKARRKSQCARYAQSSILVGILVLNQRDVFTEHRVESLALFMLPCCVDEQCSNFYANDLSLDATTRSVCMGFNCYIYLTVIRDVRRQ